MYKLTLNSLFDYTNDDGIFTYLASQNVPWKNDVDADLLDLDYHSKHGTKVVSKTVTSLLDDDGLSSANKTKLAKLLYTKNKSRWDELYSTMALYEDINPLENTDVTESRTLSHSGTDSKTQTIGQKQTTFQEGQQIDTFNKGSQSNSSTIGQQTFTEGSQSDTTGQQVISDSAQTNQTGAHIDTKETKKSAYNSSSTYSPDVQETDNVAARSDTVGAKTTTNGERTDTKGSREDTTSSRSDSSTEGAREDSSTKGQRTDTTTEGSQSNSESGQNAYSDTESIRRHGNIGIQTASELLTGYRSAVNWQFFEIIYKDIDAILCLEVFGCDDDDFSDYKIVTPYTLPIASAQKLGGIKVGQNLSIASDGTLNAQAGGGAVSSVNGKTGEVTLDASDVGAAPSSIVGTVQGNSQDIVNIKLDINQLQGSVLDLTNRTGTNETDIVNIKLDITQLQGSVLGLHNDLVAVRQVPTGGTEGQVLTKGASGYDWQTPQAGGGGLHCYHVFHDSTNPSGTSSSAPIAVRMDNKTAYLMAAGNYGTPQTWIQMTPQDREWQNMGNWQTFPGNQGRLMWDGDIAFVMGTSSSSLYYQALNDLYVMTENQNYENNLYWYGSYRLSNGNWIPNPGVLSGKTIHKLAFAYVGSAYDTNPVTLKIQQNNEWVDVDESLFTVKYISGMKGYYIKAIVFNEGIEFTNIWFATTGSGNLCCAIY